jgi:AcrR family transcriptional regulator
MTEMQLRATQPRRRTQNERRRATQKAIMKAAIEILVEDGYARFSTIRVAERAGVSRGARENYYRTKYDLIEAAWRAALARATEHARRLARRASAADSIDRLLSDSQSFFLSRAYMAIMELVMAARTDPDLARIFHMLYREHRPVHDTIWVEALVREGYARRQVESFVDLTNYLLRGMALTSTWENRKPRFRAAIAEWRQLAAVYLKHGHRAQRPIPETT